MDGRAEEDKGIRKEGTKALRTFGSAKSKQGFKIAALFISEEVSKLQLDPSLPPRKFMVTVTMGPPFSFLRYTDLGWTIKSYTCSARLGV